MAAVQRRLGWALVVLAAVPFVMVLGNSMLIPVFPALRAAMDLTPFQVGLLITAFSLPAGLLIPFAGAASDQWGRKVVMAPALVLYGLGGLLAGLAGWLLENPYPYVLGGRVLQGLGAGGTYQLAMALTGDLFPRNQHAKLLGFLEASNGFGKLVSPILGAAIGLLTWYAPFFAYGLLALPVAVAVWFVVPEAERPDRRRSLGQYWQALKRVYGAKGWPLLGCYLVGMAGLFLLFGLLSFLSDHLEARFGIAGFRKGLVLAIPVGTMALTSFAGGLLLQSRRRWLKMAAVAGIGATAVALAALPLLRALVPLLAATALAGLGIGLALPALNTLITGATGPQERGLVTALYGTGRFTAVALGPPTFGLVQAMGLRVLFWGAAALAALAMGLALLLIDPRRLLAPGDRGGPSSGQKGEVGPREEPEATGDEKQEEVPSELVLVDPI